MEYYLLPIILVKGYFSVAISLTLIFSIFSVSNEDFKINVKELTFCSVKCIGYLLLAIFIYIYYLKADKIPALDFFAFILATFEGGHNFVNSFGLIISAGLKLLIQLLSDLRHN